MRADDLAVLTLQALLERTTIAAAETDGILFGAVMREQARPGATAPFLACFPDQVGGLSLERAGTTAIPTPPTKRSPRSVPRTASAARSPRPARPGSPTAPPSAC